MDCSTPGLPVPYLASPEVCPSSCPLHRWCHPATHPLMPSSPPAFDLSQHQGLFHFSIESAVFIRWPKYWSFNFSISPSNQYSGLIFLKIDWFDLLAVQGTYRILSSPVPQFEGISSLVFCLLYGPALTTLHDLWEDHSLNYMDLLDPIKKKNFWEFPVCCAQMFWLCPAFFWPHRL